MPFDVNQARAYLQAFDLKTLFIEALNWDRYRAALPVTVDEQHFTLTGIAEKRGLIVYTCLVEKSSALPTRQTRLKIEKQVTKTAHEHVIIFHDADQTMQMWQWVKREHGKVLAPFTQTYHRGQSGDPLLQRLEAIYFDFAEEDELETVHVTGRTGKVFDVDRVTKRFYEQFTKEHSRFLAFIEGIVEQTDREWYASLMLNRLMFVYFIQKKGFLDGDRDYLRHRLARMQHLAGKDTFLSFYRRFLLRLFHEGLGQQARTSELDALIGQVPYLNGGLFDVHELERDYSAIEIPDAAFEKIFDFFDQYQWHLDARPLHSDKEINPDVLGYIFEKYINQKQMGAYYTKEDITEYISKNTILPFLVEAATQKCLIAFKPDGAVWRLLRDNPDLYIYPAVRKGTQLPLPAHIAPGLAEVAKRDGWNQAAPEEYALPTETWREVVARRKRYEEIKARMEAGEITAINDLITYNLDIRQFVQDAIRQSEGPELLRAFYHAIEEVTVLDPTCGSGAFLFAALHMLQPLYEACLERMQAFMEDLERASVKPHPEKFSDFRKILARVREHPSQSYYILKTIIINNLYGVDIMEEAVEIAKLRLFLKLVAQVERVADIEPLPDIDFNIRAGNTLVGFATYDEVQRAVTAKLDFDNAMPRIAENALIASRAFQTFHEMQNAHGMDGTQFSAAKAELRRRLNALGAELNRYLAGEYGVDAGMKAAFEHWQKTHQPFHWFIEFYAIMNRGGFDVIIGNPPYVEYSKVKKDYLVRGYKTEACGNLYALVLERNKALILIKGRSGMIVPHSAFCTDRMEPVMNLFTRDNDFWLSTYDIRPAKLFVGVDQRLAIYVEGHNTESRKFNTHYHRWQEEHREYLFPLLHYSNIKALYYKNSFPKVGNRINEGIWRKIHSYKLLGNSLGGNSKVNFHNAPRYWIRAMTFAPYFWNERDGEQLSTQVKTLFLPNNADGNVTAAALNSSLFYWWFILLSDSRHLNMREIEMFPLGLPLIKSTFKDELTELCKQLMRDYKTHSMRKDCIYKTTGRVVYDEFYPKYSKPIIDEIDRVLAKHYGFTDEELDFIINYDIKYRMGREEAEEE